MTGTRPRVAVVGGGITGLTTAFELSTAPAAPAVTVLEAAEAVGGKIAVHRADGYTVDLGPNGFIDNGSDTRTLAEALGLAPALVRAADAARDRFLLRHGRLCPLPDGVPAFLASGLLSPWAKARVAVEPLVGRAAGEESVHAFLARRFGRRAADLMAAPLVHGVTAGDPAVISLDAAFPRIRTLEREHRSLLLAALRARRRQAAAARRLPPAAGAPGPRLTSFRDGGMRVLVDTLARRLTADIRTAAPVTGIEPTPDGGWRLAVAGAEPVSADHVVLTVPAPAAARLLGPHLPTAAEVLAALRHAAVRVLALGYPGGELGVVPRGFGYLTVPGERTRILGAVHSSVIFPDSAPPGAVLLRAFAGGAQDPEFARLTGDEAVAAAHLDFSTLYRAAGRPEFVHDHVWTEGIPQYDLGHGGRIRAVLRQVAGVPGLHLAGAACHGVAVNDCVRDGRRVAEEVLTAIRARPALPLGPRPAGRG
ncbi:protoporphyrinogen oxidase [Streptomyces sp. SAJ15]|uniref:protoporphyrinogen oxidase n=1 Tax=Streptomyces sp. SAJ15 TaxID=2011095 RepID=UPI001642AB10|nr:protoporphyrinogen oxidase [Streptomyces sp. SAJ15]